MLTKHYLPSQYLKINYGCGKFDNWRTWNTWVLHMTAVATAPHFCEILSEQSKSLSASSKFNHVAGWQTQNSKLETNHYDSTKMLPRYASKQGWQKDSKFKFEAFCICDKIKLERFAVGWWDESFLEILILDRIPAKSDESNRDFFPRKKSGSRLTKSKRFNRLQNLDF